MREANTWMTRVGRGRFTGSMRLGRCRAGRGAAAGAFRLFRRREQRQPCSEPGCRLNAALHDQLQGNLSAAKSEYDEVLKADPTNVYAHYNLGLIAQTQRQKVTAEGQYRSALQSNPNFEPALFNLGILLTQDSAPEAITEYERPSPLTPTTLTPTSTWAYCSSRPARRAQATLR